MPVNLNLVGAKVLVRATRDDGREFEYAFNLHPEDLRTIERTRGVLYGREGQFDIAMWVAGCMEDDLEAAR